MTRPPKILRVVHTPWATDPVDPDMTNTVDRSPRIRLTSRHVEIGGSPAIPVSGEIHYSRVPRAEWEERLRLMKSGGITVAASYVFWLHHEEERGRIRFDGNLDVAAFVGMCDRVGLDVVLRIGPWCHGEARNGGFPDWVVGSPVNTRTNDPGYLDLVRAWFARLGEEIGEWCGPDGPIIGIQLENELYDQPAHIESLKRIARENGLFAPVWTATAWGGADLPAGEVLPLFGGYGDGFWVDSAAPWDPTFRSHFFFSHEWDDPGIGADLRSSPVRAALAAPALFPPATCEIGGGMATAYHRRPRPTGLDIAAVAHAKLGSGSAWQGYYMFAGGTNPPGRWGMQESQATGYPNDLPRFDYDFAAPIGATGRLAESFGLLRAEHAFLAAFGGILSTMPSSLPDERAHGVTDKTTLRWALRSDGDSGFLFIGWHQPHVPLDAVDGVRFRIDLDAETLTFPDSPIDVPPGTLATWPVNLDLAGVRLRWATASVLTVLSPSQRPTLVLIRDAGIPVDLAADASITVAAGSPGRIERSGPGVRLHPAEKPSVLSVESVTGVIDVLVLPAGSRARAWVLDTRRGRELVLCGDAVWVDDDGALVVRSEASPVVERYDPATRAFVRAPVTCNRPAPDPARVRVTPLSPSPEPPVGYGERLGRASAPPDDPALGARYLLELPDADGGTLDITWAGDVARLQIDGRTVADSYWDGSTWHVAAPELDSGTELTLSIVPLHPDAAVWLPEPAQRQRERSPGPLGHLGEVRLVRSSVWEVQEPATR